MKNSSNRHADVSMLVATVIPDCFLATGVKSYVTIGHYSNGLFMPVKIVHVAIVLLCSSVRHPPLPSEEEWDVLAREVVSALP
jgi:hypothetical protein